MKEVSIKKVQTLLFVVFLSLLVGQYLAGQSSYLRSGMNGVLLELDSTLNTKMSLRNLMLKTSYSMAGILDVGLISGLTFERINDTPSNAIDIELFLAGILLKQNATAPFSLQLRAGYGYNRFVKSEYLEERYLRRYGRGFTLGVNLIRDFNVLEWGMIHAELGGGVKSLFILTEATMPDVDYSLGEDKNRVWTRAVVSLPLTMKNGTQFTPGLKIEYDLDGRLSFGPMFHVLVAGGD